MKGQGKLLAGMMAGAGAMYLLDPDRGARRRSLLRDQGIHVGHRLGEGVSATARDAKNRTLGAAAQLRARLRQDHADDEVLHERVQSAIGRAVSHPGAITVTVTEGRITLSGHVLADEVDVLVDRVERVRGVTEVQNELQIHQAADGESSLQGVGRPTAQPSGLLQENWTPTTRLIMGMMGGLLVVRGSRIKGQAGRTLMLAGVGLVTRAASNILPHRLVGLAAGRGIEVEKTVSLEAPVEEVWELWSNFENFPRFMAHLREVRKLDNGHSHWVAVGPAGIPVEWDAVVTDWVPQQFMAWTSVPGSSVETTGQVRFRRVSDSASEIDVQMRYTPPAGAAGHAIAALFGADPKRAMDDDLNRLKSLLETGKTTAAETEIHLEEVAPKARSRKRSAPKKGNRS